MIRVNNVVKTFGDFRALDGVNLHVRDGAIYGLVGPNGAGKSTTMNMITGYIASTEGTVTIDGHDILDEPEQAKKCIGYLPEMPPLYFDMTVGEDMKFVADLKKIPKDQKKTLLEEVMELVKITDMKNRLIKNLSKGYKQRVRHAAAKHGDPEILILDEPTAQLDPAARKDFLVMLQKLHKEYGLTIILTSHNFEDVMEMSDECVIFDDGIVI